MAEAFGFSWSKARSFLAPVIAEQPQASKKTGSERSTSAADQNPPQTTQSSRPPVSERRTQSERTSPKVSDGGEPELVMESSPETPIFDIPKATLLLHKPSEQDWEVLSDRASVGSGVFIPRAGSVRSLASHSSKASRSPSWSSSTIDTQDMERLGPSGKGVLGVDYVEHIVIPTDTLQGICIAYKVKASNLRRANHFTGHSLHSAPQKLLIPLSKQALRTGFIRVQDTASKEYKLHYLRAEYPDLTLTEIKAYLELSDWDLKDAIRSAKEDSEWEQEVNGEREGGLKPGQIKIEVDQQGEQHFNIRLKGTGYRSRKSADNKAKEEVAEKTAKTAVPIHANPPAIATNAIPVQDAHKAVTEHQSYGVELSSFNSES